jgi:hypothetical protein
MLYRPRDTVPVSGFYQCIFCRSVVRCLKGDLFPACPAGCKKPCYAFTKKA